jgi:plasmid stabilization system protein ParE
MPTAVFSRLAEAELEEIAAYIARDNPPATGD